VITASDSDSDIISSCSLAVVLFHLITRMRLGLYVTFM